MCLSNRLLLLIPALAAIAAICCRPALADDVIKVGLTADYLNDQVGTEGVRSCDWNSRLVQYAVHYGKGRIQVVDGDLAQESGDTLKLTIVDVHAFGGGAVTGPKWAHLDGEVLRKGKAVAHFSARSKTIGPFTVTTCGALDKMAKQLGAYVAKWVAKRDKYMDSGEKDVTDDNYVNSASPPATAGESETPSAGGAAVQGSPGDSSLPKPDPVDSDKPPAADRGGQPDAEKPADSSSN